MNAQSGHRAPESAGRCSHSRRQAGPFRLRSARGGSLRLLGVQVHRCSDVRPASDLSKTVVSKRTGLANRPLEPAFGIAGGAGRRVVVDSPRCHCPASSRARSRRARSSHRSRGRVRPAPGYLVRRPRLDFALRRAGFTGRPLRISALSLLVLMSFPSAPGSDGRTPGSDGSLPPEHGGQRRALRLPDRVGTPGVCPDPSTGAGGAAFCGAMATRCNSPYRWLN